MQLQIEKIYRNTGISKNGNQYTTVDVYADGTKYTAFDYNGESKNWNEGQTINVEVEEKEWNGKTQYNIVFPKKGGGLGLRLQAIEDRLAKVENHLGLPTNGTLDVRPKKETDFKLKEVTNEFTNEIVDSLPF